MLARRGFRAAGNRDRRRRRRCWWCKWAGVAMAGVSSVVGPGVLLVLLVVFTIVVGLVYFGDVA